MEEGGAIKIMHQENTASKEKKEGLASLQKKYNSVHAPHDIANKYQLPKVPNHYIATLDCLNSGIKGHNLRKNNMI